MNTRFVLAFLAVACLATSVSALHAHGVHSVGTFNGIHCTDVSFGVDFGSVPNVVVSMDHRTKPAQHDAVSHWVTSVTATGFRACVTETGHYDQAHDGHLHYNWLAYTNELLAIDAPITVYAPGSRQCSYVNFGTTFSTDVNVHATLSHGSETTGASIWIENIFADKVEVCAEGTKDHPYTGAATAFLAIYEDASSLAIGDSHHGQVRFPSWTQSSTKCVDVALDLDFVPTYGLVTINHRSYTGTSVHHATTVWLEELSSSKVTICIGELEQYDSSHDDNLHVLYTIGGRDELDIGTCPTVVVAKPPPGQKITESSPGNCICLEFDCDE